MKKKILIEVIESLQRQINKINSKEINTLFRIDRLEQTVFMPDKKPTDWLWEDSKMKKLMDEHAKDAMRKAFEAGVNAVLAYVDQEGFPVLYNEFPFDNWYEETYIRTRKNETE
jgi:predicted oxidoreductase (fatty acid repression mutant protein)